MPLVPRNQLGSMLATLTDIGLPVYLPSGGDDGAPLTALAAGRTVLVVPFLPYKLFTPVRMSGGGSIVSFGLTSVSSKGTLSDQGSAVFQVQPSFASPDPVPAAFEWIGSTDLGGRPNSNQGGLQGIWVDNTLAPPGVAGHSIYGEYGAGSIIGCVVRGNPSAGFGDGISFQPGAIGKAPDGWQVLNSVYQSCGGVGVNEIGCSDLYASNVHGQNCFLDCIRIGSGTHGSFHPQHIGCRGDVSATGAGIKWDQPIGTNPLDGAQWIGGGTQLNATYGHDIGNSRAAGKSDPIKIVGGTYDGDTLAAFHVAGPNVVTIEGADVLITSGNPPRSLITDFGSDGVSPPDRVRVAGASLWAGAGTGNPVVDNAGMIAARTLVIDPGVTMANGAGLTSFVDRIGTATLSGGTKTVVNQWATANSVITAVPFRAGGTQGNLSVGAGSGLFVVNSDNPADTSSFVWQIWS